MATHDFTELNQVLADIAGAGILAHDFHTECEGEYTVLYADSAAALYWCYDNLPQALDRIDLRGFRVETRWIDIITDSMRHDRLVDGDAEEQLLQESMAQQVDA